MIGDRVRENISDLVGIVAGTRRTAKGNVILLVHFEGEDQSRFVNERDVTIEAKAVISPDQRLSHTASRPSNTEEE